LKRGCSAALPVKQRFLIREADGQGIRIELRAPAGEIRREGFVDFARERRTILCVLQRDVLGLILLVLDRHHVGQRDQQEQKHQAGH